MIKLKKLVKETFVTDTERFYEPLRRYVKKTFKEYDDSNDHQLTLFAMKVDDMVEAFLHKILSIPVYYAFDTGDLPTGSYIVSDIDYIEIEGVDRAKYRKSVQYRNYVDSVIFHELIHAINYHKKLFDEETKDTYDMTKPTEDYYKNPEEVRAYRAQIRDFLVDHLKLTRKQAEALMNKYSTDRSASRAKWIAQYYDMKEVLKELKQLEKIQSYL